VSGVPGYLAAPQVIRQTPAIKIKFGDLEQALEKRCSPRAGSKPEGNLSMKGE